MNYTLSINDMQSLLAEAAQHMPPRVEKNIFEIENVVARYEDVTSDVLRFLLAADESHQLGPVFLTAFFNCMKAARPEINVPVDLTAAHASTRVRTDDGKYPDFVVSGRNWVLIIENKIDAALYNPLVSYEQFAKQHFPNAQHFFVILSPDVKSKENWISVTYRKYCLELKQRLNAFDQTTTPKKWLYFAQDFVSHLQTKICPTMRKLEPNERAFIEDKLAEVAVLGHQMECYMQELMDELSAGLKAIIPSGTFYFHNDPKWGLYCDEPIEGLPEPVRCFFKTPAHDLESQPPQFAISLWLKVVTPAQQAEAPELFASKVPDKGGGYWIGDPTPATRSEAVSALCQLVERLMSVISSTHQGNL